jgi:hypothetical protein
VASNEIKGFFFQTYAFKYILIYLDKDQLKTLYFDRMNLQSECKLFALSCAYHSNPFLFLFLFILVEQTPLSRKKEMKYYIFFLFLFIHYVRQFYSTLHHV